MSERLQEAVDRFTVAQLLADVSQTSTSTADTFLTYRSRMIYAQITGKEARREGDVRLLEGSATMAHQSTFYRANNSDDAAVDSLRRLAGGLEVSAHIAGVSGNSQDVFIRKGDHAGALQIPIWAGAIAIFDEVTAAAAGTIKLNLILLFNVAVVRESSFARVEAKHS